MHFVNFMSEGSNRFGEHNRVRKRIPRINNAFSKRMTITNSNSDLKLSDGEEAGYTWGDSDVISSYQLFSAIL